MILKSKWVILGDGQTVIENGAVVVENKKVIWVGEASECTHEGDVIDYGESTILPGLIDLHIHLGFGTMSPNMSLYKKSPGLQALAAADELKQSLSCGVTTVRTVADLEGIAFAMKTAQDMGLIGGSRYITSNRGITSTGGHGTQMDNFVVEADGTDNIRKAIRNEIKNGADWIKILASHRSDMVELTLDEMKAAADEAHRWLRKICVHAGTTISVEYAIQAGFDSIEHGIDMTVDQAHRAAKQGTALVPTALVILSNLDFATEALKKEMPYAQRAHTQETFDVYTELVKWYHTTFKEIMNTTDILIGTGTDTGSNFRAAPVAEEIETLVSLGMAPLRAIQCGTENGAKILGREDIGLLKEGRLADVLVVEGNPLADIKALVNVKDVYLEGECVFSK